MIREIVQAGHPALRMDAQPIDPAWIGTPEFNGLVADMVETMHHAPGVGLAAPQIGLPIQLVVLEDRPEVVEALEEDDSAERQRSVVPLTVLVNPKIKTSGRKNVEFYEGCLSISGWAGVTPRYPRAKVTALNEKGESVTLDWEGWPARILQHECDHLVSTLYIDHMDTRTFATTDNLQKDFDEEDEDDDFKDED